MRILFIGDVVSVAGCEHIRKVLPSFKKTHNIDFCIINGENSALGNGISLQSCDSLLTSGADLITTGNHALKKAEIENYFENENIPLIRPANLHKDAPGKGYFVLQKGALRLGVINLMGRVYMDFCENPFDEALRLISFLKKDGINNILIDFHAEATSEKKVMGYFCDGKVSAVVGTHTHIQTADETVLPGGSAYITDVGMTGTVDSVLGVSIESASKKIITGLPVQFRHPDGICRADCVIIETDNKTGKAVSIERFNIL